MFAVATEEGGRSGRTVPAVEEASQRKHKDAPMQLNQRVWTFGARTTAQHG